MKLKLILLSYLLKRIGSAKIQIPRKPNTVNFTGFIFLKKISLINPKLIILAGFLLKVPENLIKKFDNKIINIHPSLLPKYGGKGMYGMHVHKEVIKNKEEQSGISIHYVNNQYDNGKIIFQKSSLLINVGLVLTAPLV